MTSTQEGSHRRESEVEANVRVVVRMLMAARGVKAPELALRLGVSRTAMFNRLGGHKPFTLAEVGEIADFFDVPPGILLVGPNSLLRSSDALSGKKLTHTGRLRPTGPAEPMGRPRHRMAHLRLVA